MRLAILVLVPILALSLAVAAEDELPFDPQIDALLGRVQDGDREERRAALDSLLGRKSEDVNGLVVHMLSETRKEVEVVEDILRALGLHRVTMGVETVVEKLDHKDPSVRSHAAVCLERLEQPDARKALLKRVGKERDTLALKNALRALGKVGAGEVDAGNALIKRFTHKTNIVAANAVLAASHFKEEGRVRSMVASKVGSLLSRTSDVRVRSACLYSIGVIGTKKELPALDTLRKSLRGNPNPLALGAINAANIAEEKIKTGSTDEMGDGASDFIFRTASDDERDPARDGDPTKELPAWMDAGNRGGGWRGGGRGR